MSSQQGEAHEGSDERHAGAPRWLTIVSIIVLAVGIALVAVFGYRYAEARSGQNVAAERDAVSDVASQVIINAFSFDHRDVDQNLSNLAEISTGDFRAEQEEWSEEVRTRVVEQEAVTTATVSHTAVPTLDLDADQAIVLVVFTAHSERAGEEDITGRQAMRVELSREDGQWKAAAVDQVGVTVPVGGSSQSVQELDGLGMTEESGEATETETEESTPAPTTSGGR